MANCPSPRALPMPAAPAVLAAALDRATPATAAVVTSASKAAALRHVDIGASNRCFFLALLAAQLPLPSVPPIQPHSATARRFVPILRTSPTTTVPRSSGPNSQSAVAEN